MDVIIYSFFIVSGIAGASYYTIKKRYARLLQEEQEKAYAAKYSELQLASEKQKLESALMEKERHIAEIKSQISTQNSHLSNEVMVKDKQLQSLSAQLDHETTQRSALEQELSSIEKQLTDFRTKAASEEHRSASLSTDVKTKEQKIESLSSQLQRQLEEKTEIERTLLEKEQLTATLGKQTMDLQQTNESLREEIRRHNENDIRAQETIRELQRQVEQLRNELNETFGMNESLNSSREQLSQEFRSKELQLQQKLSEAELYLSATKRELEKTAEMLQEQTSVREATEHALQESKQKLYALIGELEQKHKEQENAIAALQSELAQKSNDLLSAEQSIHNLLRNSPLPIFVANENGNCEYCNAALEELVGYGMDELNGKHFSRLFPEEERGFYEEQWRDNHDRSEQFQGETRIVASTGDAISASVNFTEIRPNGDTKKYIGFILDHTTALDAKKHFSAAKQREQELLDLKSRFIAMVSNQLRTSLVTIATNTELLERFIDKWSVERRYHSFLRINESISQMIELVRDVTFTTKASTENYSLSLADVNLETMFQTAAKELMADLESHHHFILSERGNVSSLRLDERLMQTIVRQLLSNAFKYSRDNTEVNVHIEQQNSSCTITVADRGIGIPAAEQKHLFSSFFRASNVSNIYGTGLGLTIAQQCVQMHGGTIVLESELNKGTTVTVTLPLHS